MQSSTYPPDTQLIIDNIKKYIDDELKLQKFEIHVPGINNSTFLHIEFDLTPKTVYNIIRDKPEFGLSLSNYKYYVNYFIFEKIIMSSRIFMYNYIIKPPHNSLIYDMKKDIFFNLMKVAEKILRKNSEPILLNTKSFKKKFISIIKNFDATNYRHVLDLAFMIFRYSGTNRLTNYPLLQRTMKGMMNYYEYLKNYKNKNIDIFYNLYGLMYTNTDLDKYTAADIHILQFASSILDDKENNYRQQLITTDRANDIAYVILSIIFPMLPKLYRFNGKKYSWVKNINLDKNNLPPKAIEFIEICDKYLISKETYQDQQAPYYYLDFILNNMLVIIFILFIITISKCKCK